MIKRQVLISQQKELATDNNVATKSGKDNNAKDADCWEREAKKWCAKLGEIRMFVKNATSTNFATGLSSYFTNIANKEEFKC